MKGDPPRNQEILVEIASFLAKCVTLKKKKQSRDDRELPKVPGNNPLGRVAILGVSPRTI